MSISKKKTVLVITGPTAVGKTPVALKLAKHLQAEIISADSRQCYKELHIGVARPSADQLAEVKHHFIASHSVHDEITAAFFEKIAIQKTEELFRIHQYVILAGGTGLYLRAFCEGLDEIPETDPSIRQKIIAHYSAEGLDWLLQEIKEKDPAYFQKGEIKNPQRMMRALEVFESTGKSILSFRIGNRTQRNFHIHKIGLELPKEELQRNIDQRVEDMLEAGLLDEVKDLIPYKQLNALNTVGYKEIFNYLDGKGSLEEATEKIKIHTRQYAKRQMTWFKKDKEINWFHPDQVDEIKATIKK